MKIMRASPTQLFAWGPFTIRRVRPGGEDAATHGSAFGPLEVIDHMQIKSGSHIAMHQHVNDEILHYVWHGSMMHEDKQGERTPLSAKKVMLMNAGRGVWHEESTPVIDAEMLQVVIRPAEADKEGGVQFMTRPDGIAAGEWTLLAGPQDDAPLALRQNLFVYDIQLLAETATTVPYRAGMAQWLYVAEGEVTLGGEQLQKGDAVSDSLQPLPTVSASRDAILLCFQVDLTAQTAPGR